MRGKIKAAFLKYYSKSTRAVFLIIAVIVCIVVFAGFALDSRTFLFAKGKLILVETARTPEQRGKGLQLRAFLEKDQGMLFFFEEEGQYVFWMKDTFISLDIAFIDKQKKVIDIQKMLPLDTDKRYYPNRNFLYALEMNTGWFEDCGIKAGDKLFFW
ncbi:MAG: DUF192 domain-containing protein [Candidatus Omnitrophica bacterium]|nr:DUF192 domain-containing protein [Candidatus Omnitrophota bacterium]